MMVFISNGKLRVSAYSGLHQVLTAFLLKSFGLWQPSSGFDSFFAKEFRPIAAIIRF